VKEVNIHALALLLKNGYIPVLSLLTHDKRGTFLNTNANTIAGEAAKALAGLFEVMLIFCLEKGGVLQDERDDTSVIRRINRTLFEEGMRNGIIQRGMISKLANAFHAIDAGVKRVVITNASEIGKDSGMIVSNEWLSVHRSQELHIVD
jgi:acetylglutamate kinase